MNPQLASTSTYRPSGHSHTVDSETCPSCGQAIPFEKLEEMRGKIALREREQALAITTKLEQQYDVQMEKLRQDGMTALETAKAEARTRETEIRTEANQAAESVIAERLAAIETARRESETALLARITEAESSKIAAEKKGTALMLQLDELQKASEAEVAKMKEQAATDAERIRKQATEAIEARLRDKLTANEKAVTEASAKALEAESKLLALAEQHAVVMAENLNSQREVLEKAKDDAVNSERAKAFEETQKLSNKVNDLQRALEKKTNEELGEGAEIDLLEALKKDFPEDRTTPIAKGAPGADILHTVMLRGKDCGTIIYDSKNHTQFRWAHVEKLKADQLAAKAEHAILSTHKFPQGKHQLHMHDGVLLANPARVVLIATLIRQHLIRVHALRLSGVERESKTAALYEFITSERCTQLLGRVEARADELLEQQAKEIKWHQKNWTEQGEAIRAIQKAKADLENEISAITGQPVDNNLISEAS